MTVYFIEMEGSRAIKIGFTARTAERRLAQLQTGQPAKLRLIGTMPGEQTDERSLHDEFKQHRLNGEWFSSEILPLVELLIERQGPWYICREPAVMWKRMEAEWISTFCDVEINYDLPPYTGVPEEKIRSGVNRINGFRRQMQKHFDRHGYMPKADDGTHSSDIYEIINRIPDKVYAAARYVAAWEGFCAPRRTDSLG